MTEGIVSNLRKLILPSVVCLVVAVPVQGQLLQGEGHVLHAPGPLPSYEVATIKPADRNDRGGMTVRSYIKQAFNLPRIDGVVLGGPAWLDTSRYVIQGKMEAADLAAMQKVPVEKRLTNFRLLQQSLLADRFKLKVHFETRIMPIYELVVAKGGPKLKATVMVPADAQNPAPHPAKGPGTGMQGPGKLSGTGTTMSMTSVVLSQLPELGGAGLSSVGRIVVDKTGLVGSYDWSLDWTPENVDSTSADANQPGLFTALQEQLGLKLVPTKGPVEVVVIDHIELPSAN